MIRRSGNYCSLTNRLAYREENPYIFIIVAVAEEEGLKLGANFQDRDLTVWVKGARREMRLLVVSLDDPCESFHSGKVTRATCQLKRIWIKVTANPYCRSCDYTRGLPNKWRCPSQNECKTVFVSSDDEAPSYI